MPQASDYLRGQFEHDGAAWDVLRAHFTESRGVIRPKNGHAPSAAEFEAIDYLVMEWDYAYASSNDGGA